jgi:hypothetical protein
MGLRRGEWIWREEGERRTGGTAEEDNSWSLRGPGARPGDIWFGSEEPSPTLLSRQSHKSHSCSRQPQNHISPRPNPSQRWTSWSPWTLMKPPQVALPLSKHPPPVLRCPPLANDVQLKNTRTVRISRYRFGVGYTGVTYTVFCTYTGMTWRVTWQGREGVGDV